ncbi:hypothetical protein [Paraburkholderia sp. SIMBA_054]|uniref:hypothetical protein n=1 Tax=Paraburkholderia sp. SIMBA_054 TaxID=3085795 RepID=UPI00397D432A
MKRIAKVRPAIIKHYYLQHHNRNSPSGQMPTNTLWHADGYKQSTHSALVVLVFLRLLDEIKQTRPNATRDQLIAHAFTRTLAFYNDSCQGDPVLSPERAWSITQHFSDKSAFVRNAGNPNGIKVVKCACCEIPLVVLSHYRDYTCELCLSGKKVH